MRCAYANAEGATYDTVSGTCYAEVGVNHIRGNDKVKGEAYEGCMFTAPAEEEPSAPSVMVACTLVARCTKCEFTAGNYFTIAPRNGLGMTAAECKAACVADDTCGGALAGRDGLEDNHAGVCYGYRLWARNERREWVIQRVGVGLFLDSVGPPTRTDVLRARMGLTCLRAGEQTKSN